MKQQIVKAHLQSNNPEWEKISEAKTFDEISETVYDKESIKQISAFMNYVFKPTLSCQKEKEGAVESSQNQTQTQSSLFVQKVER